MSVNIQPSPPPSFRDSLHFSWSNILILYCIYIGLTSSHTIHTYMFNCLVYSYYYTYFICVYYTSLMYYNLVRNIAIWSNVLFYTCFVSTSLFPWQWPFQDISSIQVKSQSMLHHRSVGTCLKQNKRNLKKPNPNLNP